MKSLLWIGAGDLAQKSVSQLNADWKTTALRRHSAAQGFQQNLLADVTQADSLRVLNAPYTHLVYSPTPAHRTEQSYTTIYQQGLENLLQHINLNTLTRFIFISSTAVYGADAVPQDEYSMLRPAAFNGESLLKAEQWLQQELGDKLCVVRFSGIYGPGRYRIFERLRQQQLRINPAMDNYANRIHSEDAARVCSHLLTLDTPLPCYVATDSTPLPARQLYSHIAKQIQAPMPILDPSIPYQSKHFSNQRLLNSGFLFHYPNTLEGYTTLLASLSPDA